MEKSIFTTQFLWCYTLKLNSMVFILIEKLCLEFVEENSINLFVSVTDINVPLLHS